MILAQFCDFRCKVLIRKGKMKSADRSRGRALVSNVGLDLTLVLPRIEAWEDVCT